MDERHAPAVGRLRDDLVPEHRPRRGEAELLDVGAAEPAREDGHQLAGPVGLRHLGRLRLSDGV